MLSHLNLLVLRARAQVFCESRLHLSHRISTTQRSQARENPVAPEGELGVIWCWRIRVDKQEHVGSISRSIRLNLVSTEQSVLEDIHNLLLDQTGC